MNKIKSTDTNEWLDISAATDVTVDLSFTEHDYFLQTDQILQIVPLMSLYGT